MRGHTMSLRIRITLLTALFGLIFLSACKTPGDATQVKLDKIKDEVLIERLDSLSKQKPEQFYTKLSSKYKSLTQSVSFKTSIRMRADSALNAVITFASLPIFVTMVTPDTLTVIDKRSKCYTQEDMTYLKNNFGVDFEHRNLEELILGMPVGWDQKGDYYQLKDPYNYIISSHNKREIKKGDKGKISEVFIQYYLSDDAKELKRTVIDSPTDTTMISIQYLGREMVDNFNIPTEAVIDVTTPRDTMHIELTYKKVTINEKNSFYLVIPDSYERCQ